MAQDKFLIAPLNSGLVSDTKPWLIPDDSFAQLNNAYVFRGRVKKRFGSRVMNGTFSTDIQQLYTRLRLVVATTDGVGAAAGIVPGTEFNKGQMFSIGTEIFTVNQAGVPAVMLTTGASTVHTFNTTTGAFNFTGAAINTDVYFYPAEPVMGLILFEKLDINDEPTYAFDTQFAYQYTGGGWERLGTAAWQGSDSQFFWGTTVRNVDVTLAVTPLLFVTNYNYADLMKYWDGVAWNLFVPNTADGTGNYFIGTARIILQFHGRLILLNTQEWVNGSVSTYLNRCRFSQVGNVLDPEAFRTDIKGKGGLIGAPTPEAIISAQFLKDRLIVFFERSTWELVYTGNQVLPFVWQKIDTTLGAESTFATVPFDKVIFGVGNVGVHACNGMNVERIDQKIPETVFEINNEDKGPERVYGIRDYYAELVYWSYPDTNSSVYPSRVLVYNYRNNTWAMNDDSITCFGYYQKDDALRWNSTNLTWEESEMTWAGAEEQAKVLEIIAGNQQGFVSILSTNISRNSASLQISDWPIGTATITCYNHNLKKGDYIYLEGPNLPALPTDPIHQVLSVTDKDTFEVQLANTVPYTGGWTMARISVIDILTKQYNFYASKGRNAQVNKVNFLVDTTKNGEVTIDYFTNSSDQSLVEQGSITGSQTGTSVLETYPYTLYPYEATQERVWHPIYIDADGSIVQLRIYMTFAQMINKNRAFSDFQMHAMMFHAKPSSNNLF